MEGALFVSLLREHLSRDEYRSWVPAYRKVRWSARQHASVIEHVGGHSRRLPHVARTDAALACTCQHHALHTPPPKRARRTVFVD